MINKKTVKVFCSYTDAIRQDPQLELFAEVEWENGKRCFVSTQGIPGLSLVDKNQELKGTVEVRQ